MKKRYRLELVGITYNQIESGVYAVILQEAGGVRRIPIVIGYPEAQAIECKLQEVVTPRPLTHDMMITFMEEFNIRLLEIEIHRLASGVFAADMLFSDGTNTRIIDARSSDAIALAIRAGVPIYTSEKVLDEAGFTPDNGREQDADSEEQTPEPNAPALSPADCAKKIARLQKAMQKAAENEKYEEAARLKEEIDRLNKSNL